MERHRRSTRILVTGAYGFIGRHVVQALLMRGHQVVAGVRASRRGTRLPGVDSIACDFSRDVEPSAWQGRLEGVDVIVNCVGILREVGADSFDSVHRKAPLALAIAAQEAGVRCFIQISALGDPTDGAFVASKHAADEELMRLTMPVTVLRPSVVYALSGSYGGTSLLRALAVTPWLLPVPGTGSQTLQPIHADDLAEIVAACVERTDPHQGIVNVGGPAPITLLAYLQGLRAWLGVPRGRTIAVAPSLVALGAHVAERVGSGPLGLTTWRMTQRGNALSAEDARRQVELFGITPRAFEQSLRTTPCHTQDRWHARLYPLAPVLRVALAVVCLVSAWAGFRLTPDAMLTAAPLELSPRVAALLGYGGSAIDALLGILLLVPRFAPAAARALLPLVLCYTTVLGLGAPTLWLDPFGGLLKNLVVLPAVVVYLVLADRR
jgi:uncharacterized protein YbjT (DUF2867 family)